MGEEMLNETLITMVPTVFEKNNFKGYLSHSQILILFLLFLELKTSPWTQILWEAIIFDTQHDALKVLLKLKNFGKSRNYIWVPPSLFSDTSKNWSKKMKSLTTNHKQPHHNRLNRNQLNQQQSKPLPNQSSTIPFSCSHLFLTHFFSNDSYRWVILSILS